MIIVNCSSLFFSLFADDVNALKIAKNRLNLIEAVNEELVKIVQWIDANKLSLNMSKICCMIFSKRSDCNL